MENFSAEIGAAVVAVLTSLAAWFRAHSEVSAVKTDREATKASRDEDSRKMHDQILVLEQQLSASKQDVARLEGRVESTSTQINQLNNQLSIVLTKMDSTSTPTCARLPPRCTPAQAAGPDPGPLPSQLSAPGPCTPAASCPQGALSPLRPE